jgi:hypothetical protein
MSDYFINNDHHLDPPDDPYYESPELQGHQEELLKDLEKMTADLDFNQGASDEFYEAVEEEVERLRRLFK